MSEVASAVGTYADLQAKGDVQYTYIYRDNNTFTEDISTERYLFDGELSWARYDVHNKFVFPGQAGPAVQGWDGENAWTTLDGQAVTDPQAVGVAEFLRKTNFYWFAMMQKLSDPGTIHEYKGTREVNGVDYELIELSFESPEDLQSDTYLLYIHPETHRVDRFLFTVVDFGITDPVLMEVSHQRFGDVVLPITRRYTPALSWDGDVAPEAVWIDEQMSDIQFNNGFSREDFKAPR
ncbi:MAG: hypothetical protein AAGB29_09070 [Planctomycetota bacterium]